MKILVVDDNIQNVDMAAITLETAGYEPLTAYSGYEALDIMENEDVRLLLIDWMMPEMDGIELVRRIRAQFSERYIYIIMLTAKDSKEDTIEGLEVGADDYVTKPFLPRELRARIAIGERIIDMESRLSDHLEHMENLATRDHLTQLYNRRRFLELAESHFEKEPVISVFMVDVDRFKSINDRYGHAAGDKVLIDVAQRCAKHIEGNGMIGRYGGEEFVGLLPGMSHNDALAFVNGLCKTVSSSQIDLIQNQITVTASIGLATCSPNTGCTLDDTIKRADDALYRAKANGRNRVEFAS